MATFTGSNGSEILPDLIIGPIQAIGNDFVDALGGDDIVVGWSGDDVLRGGAGADIIIGGLLNAAGVITPSGIDAADYTTSVDGVTIDLSVTVSLTLPRLGVNVQLTSASQGFGGDAEGDFLQGITHLIGSNTGNDRLTGSAGANVFNGQGGDDVLNGGGGNDILLGGAGNDILIGGAGADSLQGGAGFDIADYSGSAAAVTINLLTGTGSGGDAQGDTLTGIERLIGSAFADSLTGSFGNDVLEGGAGADALDGGSGADTASYERASTGVIASLDSAYAALMTGDAAGDMFMSIENLTGSAFDDVLIGDAGANALNGGGGNDVLEGGAGADVLDGAAGANLASYEHSDAGVTVNLTTGVHSGGHAEGDTLINIQNLRGSLHDDVLTGDAGSNRLHGMGADGAAGDALYGMGGNDFLLVGNGNVAMVDGGDGTDFVYIARDSSVAFAEGSLVNVEALYLHANTTLDLSALSATPCRIVANNDATITATNSDDRIILRDGDHILAAGGGSDLISAGAGEDTFIFTAGFGTDRIWGIDTATDHLDLSALGLTIEDLTFQIVGNGQSTRILINGDADDSILLGGVVLDQHLPADFLIL